MRDSFYRASAATIAVVLCAGSVRAQTSGAIANAPSETQSLTAGPAEPAAAGEIVVTALKRNESVQRVPATINVVTAETLTARGITSPVDLAKLVPGFQISNSPANTPTTTIRGLGTQAGTPFDQSVAIFQDGIFGARGRDYSASLFDVEAVQIVKGTQSAILGKNTSLGAIVLTTRKPTFTTSAEVRAQYEVNLGSPLLQAALNLPLSETIAVRFAGKLEKQGGYIRNVVLDEKGPRNRMADGRATALWRPSDAFETTLSFQIDHARTRGGLFETIVDANGVAAARAQAAGISGFELNFDRHIESSQPAPGLYPGLTDDFDAHRVTSISTLTLGEHTLSSTFGYTHYRDDFGTDLDEGVGSHYDQGQYENTDQFSQEIRLASPAGERIEYVLGGMLFYNNWTYNRLINSYPDGAAYLVNGEIVDNFTQRTYTASAFGQVTIRPFEGFSVTGGLRYTDETKKSDIERIVLRPGNLSVQYPSYPLTRLKRNEQVLDPTIAIQYNVAPRLMVYSSYGQGTKSGTFLSSPTTPATAEVPKEVARTYEVGAKLRLPSGGYLSAAAFRTRISGYQFYSFNGAIFVSGSLPLQSKGIEFDALLRPLSGLSINAGLMYDAVKRRDVFQRMNRAPKWSGSLTATYDHKVGNDFVVNGSATFSFRSRIYIGTPLIIPVSPNTQRVDLRLGGGPSDKRWDVGILVRNLFDVLSTDYGLANAATPGAASVMPDLPRTVALQMSIKF